MKKWIAFVASALCAGALCVTAASADDVIVHADVQKGGPVAHAFTICPDDAMDASIDGHFEVPFSWTEAPYMSKDRSADFCRAVFATKEKNVRRVLKTSDFSLMFPSPWIILSLNWKCG